MQARFKLGWLAAIVVGACGGADDETAQSDAIGGNQYQSVLRRPICSASNATGDNLSDQPARGGRDTVADAGARHANKRV